MLKYSYSLKLSHVAVLLFQAAPPCAKSSDPVKKILRTLIRILILLRLKTFLTLPVKSLNGKNLIFLAFKK